MLNFETQLIHSLHSSFQITLRTGIRSAFRSVRRFSSNVILVCMFMRLARNTTGTTPSHRIEDAPLVSVYTEDLLERLPKIKAILVAKDRYRHVLANRNSAARNGLDLGICSGRNVSIKLELGSHTSISRWSRIVGCRCLRCCMNTVLRRGSCRGRKHYYVRVICTTFVSCL